MFNYIFVDVFSFFILVLIGVHLGFTPDRKCCDRRIFLYLIFATMMMLIFDIGMVLVDGQTFFGALQINRSVTLIYYLINPLPSFFWALYVEALILQNETALRKKLPALLIPALISWICSVISLFHNVLFVIDASNVYHRGDWFLLSSVICFFYLIYAAVRIFRNRKQFSKQECNSLLLFAVIPFIGGLIQTMIYGITTIWTSVTFGVLMVYINIQNTQMHTDHLTGLYNRMQMDRYLNYLVEHPVQGKLIGGIMIDLDDFKIINDVYGHKFGDQALHEVGLILKGSFRKDDFVSRYGGDEFAVILVIDQMHDIDKTIDRLNRRMERYNNENHFPFRIELSVGKGIFDVAAGMSADMFLKLIDDKMYEEKRKKKVQSTSE
ncbi:MAG: GGDEF domain-containing protein [Anaerofustis sp.]